MATSLTIGARAFRSLVDPVLPFAGRDGMLPVLNAVRIESTGTHLLAMTTDRFRIGVQRLATEGDKWPAFEATIPLAAVRSIKTLFKVRAGDLDSQLTLTVDDGILSVESTEANLLDMLGATARYSLDLGEYPEFRQLVEKAIKAAPTQTAVGINAAFLADFRGLGGRERHLSMKLPGDDSKPVVFADGEDFLGILMPRRMPDDVFPALTDWLPLLAEKPAKKKTGARKPAAKKAAPKKAVA